MAVVTWRMIRLQRAKAADAAAQATDAAGPSWDRVPLRRTLPLDSASPVPAPAVMTRAVSVAQDPPPVAPAEGNRQVLLSVAAVSAAVGLFAIGAVWAVSSTRNASAGTSPAAAQVTSPLELVALDYTRDGAQASIRGLIRNPAGGSAIQQLEAVVILFDRRGGYVGTAHAAVADGSLAPGSERSFEVPLAAGLDVSQYRVSFRMAAAPVPYVDRRPVPVATPRPLRDAPPDDSRRAPARSADVVS